MSSLQEILDRLAPADDGFGLDVPQEWGQGRTLYGGMSAALAYTAVVRAFGDLGPLRSAQFAFIGPAAGRLTVQPTLLRQGRSSAIASADSHTEDGIAARATFVFGAARESLIAHDHVPRAAVPPPDTCEPFHRSARQLPGFIARYEYRLAAGARILEPDKLPEFAVWVRLRDGDAADPVATLLAVADALPGAALAAAPRLAPISTMTWAIDLHQPLACRPGWHLVRSASEQAAEGYSVQAMRMFNADGAPLASARQVVAVFV
jgi:acyl-CoA thioesterase